MTGDYVYIAVKDCGTGIPPEYIDRIFDIFVQVKDRDIEVRGTRLGHMEDAEKYRELYGVLAGNK